MRSPLLRREREHGRTHLSAPKQGHRRSLRRVPVLVGVRGYGGDASNAEVKRRDRVAQASREGQDEAAQTAVHVQAALAWAA